MEYKVEDLKLLKKFGKDGYIKFYDMFRYVNGLTKENKLFYANEINDGRYYKILELVANFNEAKDNHVIKFKNGRPNTNSLKAWINKNDKFNLLTKYGSVGMINNPYFKYTIYCQCLSDKDYLYNNCGIKYAMLDAFVYESINNLYKKEMEYFCTHDETTQLNKALLKYTNSYGWLMNGVCHSSKYGFAIVDDNNNIIRSLTIAEMHELIARYEQLETVMAELTIDFSIRV